MDQTAEKLVIAGSRAPDVLKVLHAMKAHGSRRYDLVGFIDVDEDRIRGGYRGLPVWDQRLVTSRDFPDTALYVNVGRTMALRQRVVAELRARGFGRIVSMISPDVDLWEVDCGEGCIIMQGCVIGPRVMVRPFSQILMGANVNHESELGEYSFIGPNSTILGRARIGKGVYLGGSVTVLPGVEVGDWSVVGAGAVVTRDVEAGSVVAGVPARRLRAVDESLIGR